MIKIDWSKGPQDATLACAIVHTGQEYPLFYKFINGKPFYYGFTGTWDSSAHPINLILSGGNDRYKFIPKVKPRLQYRGYDAPVVSNPTTLAERFLYAMNLAEAANVCKENNNG